MQLYISLKQTKPSINLKLLYITTLTIYSHSIIIYKNYHFLLTTNYS